MLVFSADVSGSGFGRAFPSIENYICCQTGWVVRLSNKYPQCVSVFLLGIRFFHTFIIVINIMSV
jgi:hypothetical protein